MFLDPRTKLLILAMTSVSVFLNKSILIECIFVSIPSILFAQARLFRPVIKNIAVFIVLLVVFRTLFVLPWLLTIAIVAVLWRLLLNPNRIVNAVLSGIGVVASQHEWLSDPGSALAVVTAINIWSGYQIGRAHV